MTATVVDTKPSEVVSVLDPQHAHTSRCYWDFRDCRWQCPRPASAALRPRNA